MASLTEKVCDKGGSRELSNYQHHFSSLLLSQGKLQLSQIGSLSQMISRISKRAYKELFCLALSYSKKNLWEIASNLFFWVENFCVFSCGNICEVEKLVENIYAVENIAREWMKNLTVSGLRLIEKNYWKFCIKINCKGWKYKYLIKLKTKKIDKFWIFFKFKDSNPI